MAVNKPVLLGDSVCCHGVCDTKFVIEKFLSSRNANDRLLKDSTWINNVDVFLIGHIHHLAKSLNVFAVAQREPEKLQIGWSSSRLFHWNPVNSITNHFHRLLYAKRNQWHNVIDIQSMWNFHTMHRLVGRLLHFVQLINYHLPKFSAWFFHFSIEIGEIATRMDSILSTKLSTIIVVAH